MIDRVGRRQRLANVCALAITFRPAIASPCRHPSSVSFAGHRRRERRKSNRGTLRAERGKYSGRNERNCRLPTEAECRPQTGSVHAEQPRRRPTPLEAGRHRKPQPTVNIVVQARSPIGGSSDGRIPGSAGFVLGEAGRARVGGVQTIDDGSPRHPELLRHLLLLEPLCVPRCPRTRDNEASPPATLESWAGVRA